MIHDALNQSAAYVSLHDRFQAAFDFLNQPSLATLPDGRHEIQGSALFAMVARTAGKAREAAKLEVHNAYIDIQLVLAGREGMGWRQRATCTVPVQTFDEDKDIQFFDDAPDSWITVGPGEFAIFLPEDAHAPLVADGDIHKVVVKIAV